jgi:hypothetical protein
MPKKPRTEFPIPAKLSVGVTQGYIGTGVPARRGAGGLSCRARSREKASPPFGLPSLTRIIDRRRGQLLSAAMRPVA